jgi:hypothetical protein
MSFNNISMDGANMMKQDFSMHSGDCVLQPPQIRHRVLASSVGLELTFF